MSRISAWFSYYRIHYDIVNIETSFVRAHFREKNQITFKCTLLLLSQLVGGNIKEDQNTPKKSLPKEMMLTRCRRGDGDGRPKFVVNADTKYPGHGPFKVIIKNLITPLTVAVSICQLSKLPLITVETVVD